MYCLCPLRVFLNITLCLIQIIEIKKIKFKIKINVENASLKIKYKISLLYYFFSRRTINVNKTVTEIVDS